MIQKGNATLLQCLSKDYLAADVDRSKCLHVTSSNVLFCTHYVGDVIYHSFSHNEVSYRINGENVNVMFEYRIKLSSFCILFLKARNKMFCPTGVWLRRREIVYCATETGN